MIAALLPVAARSYSDPCAVHVDVDFVAALLDGWEGH